MIRSTILFALILATFSLQAQSKVVDNHNNVWLSNINKYNLSNKVFLSSELHIRRVNGLKDEQQFLFRPGINLKLKSNLIFSAGYTYVETHPYGKQPIPAFTPENNIWEQATLKSQIGKVKISHRYRLEHRFIGNLVQDLSGNYEVDGTNYAQRFRYRLTLARPIALKGKLQVQAFNELWLDLQDNFMPIGLNQNWVFAGLNYNFSKRGNVQMGYMNQWFKKQDGIHYESNHTLQVTLGFKFGKLK